MIHLMKKKMTNETPSINDVPEAMESVSKAHVFLGRQKKMKPATQHYHSLISCSKLTN